MIRILLVALAALLLAGAGVAQTATPTPDPLRPYTLEALRARDYPGGPIQIGEGLRTADFTRYPISYLSDGLVITGLMKVPHGDGPFPVLVLLHGYYDFGSYWSGLGIWQEAEYFARRGFLTLTPDFRNWGGSNLGDNRFAAGLVIDTLNLIASLPSLPQADPGRIGLFGHSMGGGVAAKVLAVSPEIGAAVLYAPNSADDADLIARWGPACQPGQAQNAGDFCNPAESVNGLSSAEADAYYADAADPVRLRDTSPLYHLDWISAPVQIHIGTADGASLAQTPPEWSYRLHEALLTAGHDTTLHLYPGQGHFLAGQNWTEMMLRALAFFQANLG